MHRPNDFDELFGGPNLFDPHPERTELPQPGDSLFSQEGTIENVACVNFSSEGWIGYVGGYLRGADALADMALNIRGKRDYLVYPAIFLYRHYVELQLKHLFLLLLDHEERSESLPKTHCLRNLWGIVRKGLQEVDDQPGLFDAVEGMIHEFQTLDPRSDAFRYPVNPSGNASLPRTLRHLNLEQLRNSMEKLAGFFDAATFMVESQTTMRDEARW